MVVGEERRAVRAKRRGRGGGGDWKGGMCLSEREARQGEEVLKDSQAELPA